MKILLLSVPVFALAAVYYVKFSPLQLSVGARRFASILSGCFNPGCSETMYYLACFWALRRCSVVCYGLPRHRYLAMLTVSPIAVSALHTE